MNDEQTCKQAYDDFYHKIKAEVCYDHWCAIWRFISKRQARGEPVAWLRNERDGYEGKAIFDPLVILGSAPPTKTENGATYSPVFSGPQPQQHPDDAAVDAFATAMKAKLAKKRAEGRGGWQSCDAAYLSDLLREHVEKGDPVDVANLAMMLHQNRQSIQPAPQPQQQASEPLFWYRPIADGMYEGPVHNNSVGGKMLRDEKPGEWKPLHGAPQPQQIPEGYKTIIGRLLDRIDHEGCTPLDWPEYEAARAMLEAAPEPKEQ